MQAKAAIVVTVTFDEMESALLDDIMDKGAGSNAELSFVNEYKSSVAVEVERIRNAHSGNASRKSQ